MTTLRRVGPAGLYEAGYKWDGSCRCGANEWDTELWDGGYSVHCAICGWWECAHIATGLRHTSDGLWTAPSPKAAAPAGCPCIENSPPGEHSPSVCAAEAPSLV